MASSQNRRLLKPGWEDSSYSCQSWTFPEAWEDRGQQFPQSLNSPWVLGLEWTRVPCKAFLQGICIWTRDPVLTEAFQTGTSRWGCISSGSSASDFYLGPLRFGAHSKSHRCQARAGYETWVWAPCLCLTISEALGVSFNLMGLLRPDKVCLPHGIAGKLAQAVSGKTLELFCSGFCANWELFVLPTILYLNHLAL